MQRLHNVVLNLCHDKMKALIFPEHYRRKVSAIFKLSKAPGVISVMCKAQVRQMCNMAVGRAILQNAESGCACLW